jgi:hypothetical protein
MRLEGLTNLGGLLQGKTVDGVICGLVEDGVVLACEAENRCRNYLNSFELARRHRFPPKGCAPVSYTLPTKLSSIIDQLI